MKVRVKLSGRLKAQLPTAHARGAVAELGLETGASVADAIKKLRITEDTDALLVIVDGENVPPSQRICHILQERQFINVMPPLKGG